MSFSLQGYSIFREAGHDAKHIIYHGIREKDQLPVLLKTFSISHPRLDDVARLKNEYQILSTLDLPTVIKAYALEKDQNEICLVLEDTQDLPLDKWLRTKPHTIETLLTLSIQIAEALGHLQARDIIHKDIQPENILVNPETLEVKLTGFNFATKIPRQRLSVKNPNMLEGSLPYMSPEQTGRTNQDVDYRTDFYSLGATFYKLFTNQLPFSTHDPMELVHAHIAKTPSPPCELNPELPQQISDIILKLMSKKPEERYSSTFSLCKDLERCKREYIATKKITQFPLGSNDIFHKLRLSHKIYGREKEIQEIVEAFNEVASGSTKLLLLTGYPGIGKSSLAREVNKYVIEKKGFFISGKYDQYKRNIPYSAFIEAFQTLVQQILTENDDIIALWRERIKDALGNNAGVILEFIPELRYIIGEGVPFQEFDSQETQNRFNFFLQRFISLYSSPETPLVIFLDDLQWVDPASLKLLEMVLTTLKTKGLLIIGAYRNNEITPLHPLITTIERIKREGTRELLLDIGPLKFEDVKTLVADTLAHQPETCEPLAKAVYEKTQGNPFFINQFLNFLFIEKLLYVDPERGVWAWNLEKIQTLDVSPNVIDLLVAKLQKCSIEMQETLELAACIGSQFDVRLISLIKEKKLAKIMPSILEGVQEGFILPSEDFHPYSWSEAEDQVFIEDKRAATPFRFLHDKIQQAAYQLMDESLKRNIHYKIGLILLQKFRGEFLEEHIFEVMSQLNHATDLIKEPHERIEYAELNLVAAKKAMRTVAYGTAVEFVKTGLKFLPKDPWETQYDLAFQLYLLSAEAQYLLFNFDEADRLFDHILIYAKSISDKISVHKLKIKLYISSVNYKEANNWARSGLKLLGVNLPSKHLKYHAIKEFLLLKWRLLGKDTQSLISLPQITDEKAFDIIHIFALLVTPAYLTNKEFFAFVVIKGLNLVLQYGNAPMTAYLFASYGIILNAFFEDFKGSFEFGNLAIEVNKRFEDQKYVPATKFLVGTFLNPTQRHLKTSVELLQTGYELGTSTGDFINAVFCQGMMMTDKYLIGTNLNELRGEIARCLEYVARIKSHNRGYVFNALRQNIMALNGETVAPYSMQTEEFNEEAFFKMLLDNNFLITLYFAYTFKMQICYLFENYDHAIEIGNKTEDLAFAALGQPMRLENDYYFALSLAASYPTKDNATKKKYLKKIQAISKKMHTWAQAAPPNYLHKDLLIQAELERILGHEARATELYDMAIESAKENNFNQNEGTANELFAKFYLSQNRTHLAKQYLIDAHYAFYRWGAPAKLEQLAVKYSGIFPVVPTKELEGIESTALRGKKQLDPTEPSLDLMAVIKATQMISGEIVFNRLLEQLMRIVIETAGAERAVLILERKEQWIVVAEFSPELGGRTVRPNVHFVRKKEEISLAVINYVMRTKEQVVLDNATEQSIFLNDPYIATKKPLSVLCIPLTHQAKVIGVLYLENNLTPCAFTPSRVEVLKLLTGQIATSLENSLLYSQQEELSTELKSSNEKLEDYSQNLEMKVYHRTRELNEKNKQLEETLQQIKEMQKKLIQQEKLVSQIGITKSIAAEMRNPLNYVFNFSTLAQELATEIQKINHSEEINEPLKMIQTNLAKIQDHSKKADDIITSMLEQSNDTEGQKELTDLNKLIRDFADLVYYSYYKNDPLFSLTIETDYDPSLDKIMVYPQNLGRVIYNLIDNACYATDLKKKEIKGNYSPTLSISTLNGEEKVTVKIRDNGVGIPTPVLSKVFSPFLTTKPVGKSAGMGLSISHDIIVQDHKGTIDIKSTEGLFTEVTINLPKF